MNVLEVVHRMAARLQLISAAAGYSSDAGSNVFELVDSFSSIDGDSFLSVLFEGESAPEDGRRIGCPHVQMDGDFLIVGCVESIEGAPAVKPLLLINDIKRALFGFSAQAFFSQLNITVDHRDSNVLPREDGDARVEVQVRLRAIWQEETQP